MCIRDRGASPVPTGARVQFAPHTVRDLEDMLSVVPEDRGMADAAADGLEALFAHIPASLRLDRPLALPAGRSEDEVLTALTGLAERNATAAVCFAGGGAYDHYVPAVALRSASPVSAVRTSS